MTCASRLDETLGLLRKNKIDALLLDLSLPDSSDIQTVERVRADFPHIPIVVITGNEDDAISKMAVRKGAQDYLVKGQVDRKALVRSLHYAMERKKAELEIRKAQEKLEVEVLARTAQIRRANEKLKKIIREKTRAERELTIRQEALESIYAIETSFSDSIENAYDQIVLTISNIIHVPYTAAGEIDRNKFKTISCFSRGSFDHDKPSSVMAHPAGIACKNKAVCQYSGNLHEMFPLQLPRTTDFNSYLGVPIFNKEGKVIGVICALDDKPRRFSESDVHLIEIFARYLGHEIQHTIMEERLRSSKEMNLLGLLASGVAHEVRNPLNGILAISEALFKKLGDNPEYLPFLDHIRGQVRRLSALMNDLLDLGKPMSESDFTPRPIGTVIRGVLDSFSQFSRHKHRSIRARFHALSDSLVVRTEPMKIQQVFFNVLENACDHSPEDSTVEIEIAGTEEEFVLVRVVDRGEGIRPETLPRIFQPFFTTRKGGTGLGLNLVKHFVELHGGSIGLFNSNPGPGCTAEIRLPLVQG
jgi:signal transduction histidine kinase/DNA-binding NarL/FixJ family response regulator